MRRLYAASISVTLLSGGCASAPAVRLLDTHAPRVLVTPEDEAATPDVRTKPPLAPRIGAPGGSGAGSRRVLPDQSGNETVGGLPAGMGGGSGPRG